MRAGSGRLSASMGFSILLAWPAAPVLAKEDPPTTAERTAQASADLALLQAQIALAEKRMDALGLPQTENKTTINEGGAVLEATQLTADAMLNAGKLIAQKARVNGGTKILLLSADDPLDLTLAGELANEISGYDKAHELLAAAAEKVLAEGGGGKVAQFSLPLAGIGEVVKVVAGLLGTDTTVSKVTLSGVDSTLLLKAVAHGLSDVAVVPGAIVTVDPTGSALMVAIKALDSSAVTFQVTRAKLAEDGSDDAKALVVAIDDWLKRYSAFRARISTPDKAGLTPLGVAARMESAAKGATGVLRVKLDHGAGSLIQYKNAATFFGADPVRVSGGLVASYVLTDPKQGKVQTAGLIICRTAMAKLRDIQRGKYRLAGARANVSDSKGERATCVGSD